MAYLLSLVPLLACPAGMGLMMWVMMRGNKGQTMGAARPPDQDTSAMQTMTGLNPDERIAVLRDQLAAVQEQQTAIDARIRQLSAEDRLEEPYEAVDRPLHAGR